MRMHAGERGRDWPAELTLIRHAQSAGNVARDRAHASAQPTIEIAGRDCDVPLSPLGRTQAEALGRWLRRTITEPAVAITSPYVRTRQTSEIAYVAAEWNLARIAASDERLREKEFGVLDRLTRFGIEQRFPEQAAARRALGKFYYRPPGGESWVDVILRVRSFVETLRRDYRALHVLVVAHQVIILCLRYVLEHLDEAQLLAIDRDGDVANCGVTRYVFDEDRGEMKLTAYNSVAPMEAEGAPVTREPDAANTQ
jgi:2,3-bisphosphoglycerate-dependent phosphoglycerate mutase